MDLLRDQLHADPACPRLTFYMEQQGARLDFSATTLDNWAAKTANFYLEELELSAGDTVCFAIPPSWQAAALMLGAIAADLRIESIPVHDDAPAPSIPPQASVVAVPAGALGQRLAAAATASGAEIIAVSDDPMGRGVLESGQELPSGAVDYGAAVRFYGDEFFGFTPTLHAWLQTVPGALPEGAPEAKPQDSDPATGTPRVLSRGWGDLGDCLRNVFAPIAQLGSAVVVLGEATQARLEEIAATERVTELRATSEATAK